MSKRDWPGAWQRLKKRMDDDPELRVRANAQNRAYRRKRRADPRRWAEARVAQLRTYCKKNNIPFDLDIEDLILPTHCPIFGCEFALGVSGLQPNTPSVDKIIPEKGYVKGNVAIVCYEANALKRDCTDPAKFRAIANYLEEHQDGQ